MRAFPVALLVVLTLVGAGTAQQSGAPRLSPLEPAVGGGLAAVDTALAKLSIHARMLLVGAHPDDEDNSLLAWVAHDLGGEAAYLSLTRGEGGQNLIGPELGEDLGLVRTGELLAARRIDGTRQFFARAYDFGYTRSLDETFERWPREILREDAIRAARRFKPQVVVTIFPEDERAGHGQHQASAVIARDLYELTGDPSVLPELGLPPWSPSALYRRAWSRLDATLSFQLGALEPLSGRSIGQISAASRSAHRSQDMGRLQPLGAFRGGLKWIEGGAGAGAESPFSGIDTRLVAIAEALEPPELRARVEGSLRRVEELARTARAALTPTSLEGSIPALVEILRELRAAAAELGDSPTEVAVGHLLAEKIDVAQVGLAGAAGVVVEAIAEREAIPMGVPVGVETMVWAAGGARVEVRTVELVSPAGWRIEAGGEVEEESAPGVRTWRHSVSVAPGAGRGSPYFLEEPRVGDLYDWSRVPEAIRGEPFRPSLMARYELVIEGTEVVVEREVVHRFADQALGEVRRPLRVVAIVEVGIEPSLVLWPVGGAPDGVRVDITLTSHSDRELTGELRVGSPSWWSPGLGGPVRLAPGGREVLSYRLRPPEDVEPGEHRLEAAFESGGVFDRSYPVFNHSHVRPFSREEPAIVRLQALALRLPGVERVGYIRGASDRVPELLQKVGVPLEILDLERDRQPDLSVFDTIVIGSRAYEIDPHLRRMNDRILRYVEQGGTLIVQYQQYQFIRGGFSPLPMTIARPHGRITDESSPVTVLEPDHRIFKHPNPIGENDWEGWVQERGLYFAEEWDDAFVPLLSMKDPGDRPAQRGGLLVASVGEGVYVYTGLSFFRELPAGVPGAFRLFANLLALGER